MAIKLKKVFKVFLGLIIILNLINFNNNSFAALDFDFEQHPFEIETKGYYRLKVELLEDYNFKPEAEQYYQDNLLLMYRSEDKLAVNEDLNYQINLSGYEFWGEGIYLTEEGLYLAEIEIELEDEVARRIYYNGEEIDIEAQDNKIIFTDVKISPDENQVVGEYSSEQNYYLSFGDWVVNAQESVLNEEKIMLSGSIASQNLYLDLSIPVEQIALDSELELSQVEIEDFSFEVFPGSNLEVKSSMLTEDNWEINQANLLSEGDKHLLSTEVGGFYIEPNANFTRSEDYYSKVFDLTYYDRQYQVAPDELYFSANRILIEQINYELELESFNQQIAFGPIQITEEVYDTIPWLEARFDGIRLEAINGHHQDEQIIFSEALLYLEVADELLTINFEELSYSLTDLTGLDFDNARVKANEFDYLDYGIFNYKEVEFGEQGFNILGEFYLNEDILGEEIEFGIEEFIVDGSGVVSDIKLSDLAEEKNIDLKGWDISLASLKINDLLEFKGELELPEIDQISIPETMWINQLVIDETREIKQISAEIDNQDELELSHDYKLDLRGLKIDEDDTLDEIRVYFPGVALFLPDNYTGGYIWLEEINFDSQGNLYYANDSFEEWFEDYRVILRQHLN